MKRRTEAEWIEVGNEYYASGQEQRQWCERQGIRINTFQDRLNKLRKNGKLAKQSQVKQNKGPVNHSGEITFIELKESTQPPKNMSAQSHLFQLKMGKAEISIPAAFEADRLRELLKVVSEVC